METDSADDPPEHVDLDWEYLEEPLSSEALIVWGVAVVLLALILGFTLLVL